LAENGNSSSIDNFRFGRSAVFWRWQL